MSVNVVTPARRSTIPSAWTLTLTKSSFDARATARNVNWKQASTEACLPEFRRLMFLGLLDSERLQIRICQTERFCFRRGLCDVPFVDDKPFDHPERGSAIRACAVNE